jgi:hypothetical protein
VATHQRWGTEELRRGEAGSVTGEGVTAEALQLQSASWSSTGIAALATDSRELLRPVREGKQMGPTWYNQTGRGNRTAALTERMEFLFCRI